MSTNEAKSKRGFTAPEKWVIWGVFCLLVGLSTYRFAVFAGLMILSVGLYLTRQRAFGWGVLLCCVGLLSLFFSKSLV